MMNPKNGEVLTMAGKQITNDHGKYKINDYALGAMTSSYAMGSAVKGATVLTGLQTGAINLNTVFQDEPMYFKEAKTRKIMDEFRSRRYPKALQESSNVFMFKTAIAVGKGNTKGQSLPLDMKAFDTFRYYFNQFGLGVKTGIDLRMKRPGTKGHSEFPVFC